jgi:hypothetical protein
MALARKSSLPQKQHPQLQQQHPHAVRYQEPVAQHHQTKRRFTNQQSIEEDDHEDDDSMIDYEAAAVPATGPGNRGSSNGSDSVPDYDSTPGSPHIVESPSPRDVNAAIVSIINNENDRIPEKIRQLKNLNLSEDQFAKAKAALLAKSKSEKDFSSPPSPTKPLSQRKASFERSRSKSVEFDHTARSVPERKSSYGSRYRSNSGELPTLNEQHQHQHQRPSQSRQHQQQHRPSQSRQQRPAANEWLQNEKKSSKPPERRESNFAKLNQSNQRTYDYTRNRSYSVDEYFNDTSNNPSANRNESVRLSSREPVQVSMIKPLVKQGSSNSSFERPPPSLSQALHGNTGAPRPKHWQEPSTRNHHRPSSSSQQHQKQSNNNNGHAEDNQPKAPSSGPPPASSSQKTNNVKQRTPEEEAEYQKNLSLWLT